MDWNSWYKEHRSNFVFFLLQTFGGAAVLGSIGHAIANNLHGHPTDWALFGAFVVVGAVFLIVGVRKGGFGPARNAGETSESESRAERQNPNDSPQDFQDAAREFANKKNFKTYVTTGIQVISLLTPLQIEAIQLSKDLADFMKRIGPYPSLPTDAGWDATYDIIRGEGYKWGVQMQAAYESEMSPKVNAFINHLELQTGHLNVRLRNYKDHVHDFESINTIRAQLWLEVLRQMDDINFMGEQ